MTQKTIMRLLILQESELRKAAKLLDQMIAVQSRDHADDEYYEAACDALDACLIALHGVADTDNILMLTATDIRARNEDGSLAIPAEAKP